MTGKLVDLVLRYFSIPKISVRGKGDRACSCESRPSERPSSKEVRAKVVRAKDLHRACSGERRSFVLGRKAVVRARAKGARAKGTRACSCERRSAEKRSSWAILSGDRKVRRKKFGRMASVHVHVVRTK